MESVNSMPKLNYYCKYKVDYIFEDYLCNIKNDNLRKQLTCLRLSLHNLEIETGRYRGISRENKMCHLCNQNTVESEYHFMLCCDKFRTVRRKYIGNIAWPSIQRFNSLMSSKSKNVQLNICKYIKECMKMRKEALEAIAVS